MPGWVVSEGCIFLARHGAHDELGRVLSGRSAIGLNADGCAQAERLARRLEGVGLRAVVSSPRVRAVQTAAPVAARAGLVVEQAAGLDEIDFGRWTGVGFAALEYDPDWRAWNRDRGSAATPGGETMQGVVERAWARVVAIAELPALCVSHGDVIRGLVVRVLGWPLSRLFELEVGPGSLTILECVGGDWRVKAA